jgi:hypothetical protein
MGQNTDLSRTNLLWASLFDMLCAGGNHTMTTIHSFKTRTEQPVPVGVVRRMLSDESIGPLSDEQWRTIADHIDVHRYFVGQEIDHSITWEEAVFSWYDTVYLPILRAAGAWEVRRAFPKAGNGQLYLAVSTHWHYLKERDPHATIDRAAHDFAARYGTGLAHWFSRFIAG